MHNISLTHTKKKEIKSVKSSQVRKPLFLLLWTTTIFGKTFFWYEAMIYV